MRYQDALIRAADNTFGVLQAQVLAVDGGYRDARVFDGGFEGWLCEHTHATAQEAEACPDRDGLLAPRRP